MGLLLLLLTSCNPRQSSRRYTHSCNSDRDLTPRFYPCGDGNCAAKCATIKPAIYKLQLRFCPSLICFATATPVREACLRILTLHLAFNQRHDTLLPPALLAATFSLRQPAEIRLHSLQLNPIHNSGSPIAPRTAVVHRWRGPLMNRKAPLYFWRLFLRSLSSSYTLSSSLDGSLEKLIEGEASACLFVYALLFRKFSLHCLAH